MKLNLLESPVRVLYHVYNQHPARPDATGYVPEDKLLPLSEQYIDFDADKPAFIAGFTQVTEPETGEVYIVPSDDIYTAVVESDVITGIRAVKTPGGGLTALAGKPTHEDADGIVYVRNYW